MVRDVALAYRTYLSGSLKVDCRAAAAAGSPISPSARAACHRTSLFSLERVALSGPMLSGLRISARAPIIPSFIVLSRILRAVRRCPIASGPRLPRAFAASSWTSTSRNLSARIKPRISFFVARLSISGFFALNKSSNDIAVPPHISGMRLTA